jgi:GWxTD domain-containing protein
MQSRVLFVSLLGAALSLPMAAQQQVTVAKPLTEKQKKANEKKLRKELESPYKKWMNEEVVWIITDEERSAFARFQTDDERQQFIEQFWLRRDPSPDTEENEFKEEHYRRIAWANDRFASGIPGWKTDRGMVYVKFGPPDEREEHPTGGPGVRPIEEGGGETTFFPYEKWRYRYIEGVGSDVIIEFVDKTMSNEYRMTWNPSDKDAMLTIPGAGLTLYERMGLADKDDRVRYGFGGFPGMGNGPLAGTSKMNMFDRLNQMTNLQKAPTLASSKELDTIVNSTIKYDLLPMQVQVDYIPVTETSVMASVVIQFNRADMQFSQKDGIAEAKVDLYMRLQTITGRRVGIKEQPLVVRGPAEQLAQLSSGISLYNYVWSLAPGRYKLSIAAKDPVGQNITTHDVALTVPQLYEDELSVSSLILADRLEKIRTNSLGTNEGFIIGSSKVRPRIDETYKRDESVESCEKFKVI